MQLIPYLIATSNGVWLPHGTKQWTKGGLGGWEDVLKLWSLPSLKFISDSAGNPPVLWILGETALEPLGLAVPRKLRSLTSQKKWINDQVNAVHAEHGDLTLTSRFDTRGNPRIELKIHDTIADTTRYLTVIADALMPLMGERNSYGILGIPDTTDLPAHDDHAAWELSNRLNRFIELTKKEIVDNKQKTQSTQFIVPTHIASTTAADLLDMITKTPLQPSPVKNYIPNDTVIEPPLQWIHPGKLPEKHWKGATHLIEFDARSSYLASAGTVQLGIGTPQWINSTTRIKDTIGKKIPYGLWHITFPSEKNLIKDFHPHTLLKNHKNLPPPIPNISEDETQLWITTTTLEFLQEFYGITWADLNPDQALIWQDTSRLLYAWNTQIKKLLGEEESEALKHFGKELYRSYIGRIESKDFPFAGMHAHHHQPSWAWTIRAHARTRIWRHIKTVTEHYPHRSPLKIDTDSTLWALSETEATTITDTTGNLGKFRIKKIEPLPHTNSKKLAQTPIKDLLTEIRES